MGVIFILILISMTVAGCFFGAFIWAVSTGQFEDDHTPGVRILFEDKLKNNNE
jgi:cbb3-type cytochrome oxidase maturation protein